MQAPVQLGRRAFLIELLFSMVALGICAAITLAGFARADSISMDSSNLSQAVIHAQSAAESFQADPASYEAAQTVKSESREPDAPQITLSGVTQYYFDKNWKVASSHTDALYSLVITCTEDGAGMYTAQIDVFSTGAQHPVYSLTAQKYQPDGGKEAAA